MRIHFQSELPAPGADQLTALIDLGEDRPLFTPEAARQHPAWDDLERRRKLDTDKCAAYLALGAAPLYYLPATDAKYWDDEEKIRILASRAWDAATERKARELVVLLDGPAGADAAPLAAEGIALRAYKFDKYKAATHEKANKGKKTEPALTFVVAEEFLSGARQAAERALERADSANKARELINEPGSVVTPAALEDAARKVANEQGLGIQVLDAKQLEKEGYQGLLTVGRGGAVPPRMIVLS
jgi:leucyl aminopeptidase